MLRRMVIYQQTISTKELVRVSENANKKQKQKTIRAS